MAPEFSSIEILEMRNELIEMRAKAMQMGPEFSEQTDKLTKIIAILKWAAEEAA